MTDKERLAQEKALQALHNENDRLGLYKDAYAEQEPVAWGVFEGNLHDMFFTLEKAHELARLKGSHAKVKPLYTRPPQRTWVGSGDLEDSNAYQTLPAAQRTEQNQCPLGGVKEKNT